MAKNADDPEWQLMVRENGIAAICIDRNLEAAADQSTNPLRGRVAWGNVA